MRARVAQAMRKDSPVLESMIHLVPHDSYHFGQIAYLRAMLGLPPID